jgi:hypothetical protein
VSYRKNPISEQALAELLRNYEDRIGRLEQGGATAGEISLGEKIHIGGNLDVEVVVADTGGNHRTVTFRNPLNGVTHVITL